MCGLAGFLQRTPLLSEADARSVLAGMADAIAHRGSDDDGHWLDVWQGIGLAHKRLSIQDLTSAGHQPMMSVSGRYVAVFNGEIYNHLELRKNMDASSRSGRPLDSTISQRWSGHSDTETLLATFDAWGIEAAVKRLIGMYAIAVWDRHEKSLVLVRDRIGEKPLYYGWQGSVFLFGSELGALRRHAAFRNEIDVAAVDQYLKFNYVPGPTSIYSGIAKLQPGCLLRVSVRQPEPEIIRYWSLLRTAEEGRTVGFNLSDEVAVDKLENLLKDAVRGQMVSDVPLGAFLSGGIDSTTVVALMQSLSARPVRTFSIGYVEDGYSEAADAKKIAAYLGTNHTELYVTAEDMLNVITEIPQIYDEPFSDASQVPTVLVARMARQQVKVSLSGDAGDEIFCGYNRYSYSRKYWRYLQVLSPELRERVSQFLTSVSPQAWNSLLRYVPVVSPGDKLHKAARVLSSNSVRDLYAGLVMNSFAQFGNNPGLGPDPRIDFPEMQGMAEISAPEWMMLADTLTYLPDDILTKVDRATMSVGLEGRMPFLDHRIIEYAWRLPIKYKLRHGKTKWILRQVLAKYVPVGLVSRPKMGFGVPIDRWLRGPLRAWSENLINKALKDKDSYLNPDWVRRNWEEHCSGSRNRSDELWAILMFQAWLDRTD